MSSGLGSRWWWRIFWPAAVALFFALGLVALGLDVLLVVQAAAR